MNHNYSCPNCRFPLEGYKIKDYEGNFIRWIGFCNKCSLTSCEFVVKESD